MLENDNFHRRHVSYYKINEADLPFACPPKDIQAWNHHPKVYLDFTKGDAHCPYCGAYYVMKDKAKEFK